MDAAKALLALVPTHSEKDNTNMTMTEITPRGAARGGGSTPTKPPSRTARKGAAAGPEDEANVKALHEDML